MRRTCAPLLVSALLLALAGPAPGYAAPRRSAGPNPARAAAWQLIAVRYPAVAWLWGKIGIGIDPSGVCRDASCQGSPAPRPGSNGETGEGIGILIDPDGREAGGKIGIVIDPSGRESDGEIGIRIDPDGLNSNGGGR